MAILHPLPDSDTAGDAKVFLLLGQHVDPAQPYAKFADQLIGIIPGRIGATTAAWIDLDGYGGADDLVVATRGGASGNSSIYVWLRSTEDGMHQALSDDSRYLPYYGDANSDGRNELYLSTLDHVIDENHIIHPTTYRVIEHQDLVGFVEVRQIPAAELPLDRLTLLFSR